jgi:hypothetical protein
MNAEDAAERISMFALFETMKVQLWKLKIILSKGDGFMIVIPDLSRRNKRPQSVRSKRSTRSWAATTHR